MEMLMWYVISNRLVIQVIRYKGGYQFSRTAKLKAQEAFSFKSAQILEWCNKLNYTWVLGHQGIDGR